jgi:hypothetical protein
MLVEERRKRRYEKESQLQAKFYVSRKKKEENLRTVFKDKSLKKFYDKLYERKCNDLDCGCDLQTINQFSDVDGSDAAADNDNFGQGQNCRQSLEI